MKKNLELYGDNDLIGIYPSIKEASYDAFELMLDGCYTSFEIVSIPETPRDSLDLKNSVKNAG